MNLIKSLITSYGWTIVLLVILACIAGCTEAVRVTPASPTMEPTFPIPSTSLVGVTPSPNATMNSCPIPKLIFNNSQEITKLGPANGMRIIGHNTLTGSEARTVPLGGVIYHGEGFTRVFDSAGKQILFINDTESIGFIPAGYVVPVTYVTEFTSGDMYPLFNGENVTRIYQEGYDTCIATIIQGPGAFKAPPIPPH